MSKHFVGYHGTTRESADKILKSKYFRFSLNEEDWLGPGIYFFEDDLKQAYYFCTKARLYPSWAILKSNIEGNTIIDLTKLDDFEEFQKTAQSIKNRYEKTKNGRPRKLLNFIILNIMYKVKPYDIVKGVFSIPPGHYAPRTNVYATQIQLCVRNRDCIKNTEEVKYDEH